MAKIVFPLSICKEIQRTSHDYSLTFNLDSPPEFFILQYQDEHYVNPDHSKKWIRTPNFALNSRSIDICHTLAMNQGISIQVQFSSHNEFLATIIFLIQSRKIKILDTLKLSCDYKIEIKQHMVTSTDLEMYPLSFESKYSLLSMISHGILSPLELNYRILSLLLGRFQEDSFTLE